MIDEIILKLTELLIKQDTYEKQIGKTEYISKISAYRDLIQFFKEYKDECKI